MKSKNIRPAVFAGSWYPARASDCEQEINQFIKEGEKLTSLDRKLVGGIVPHAGWYFSGSIACNVIKHLKSEETPDVFIVFGMHLHPDSPFYIMTEGAWETPFGELPVHWELAGEIAERFDVSIETPTKFTQDNTVELQLPFIKYFFKDVTIVAMGVPPARRSLEIGQAIVDIATRMDLKIKILGSTDLTHYGHNYGFVSKGTGIQAVEWVKRENDRRVIDTMLTMEPEQVINEALANQNACCAGAAATAIASGKALGAEKADTIAYATSYDKSPGDSFVGYVGIVF
jgi:AmmeMemoRadiSam system protein B